MSRPTQYLVTVTTKVTDKSEFHQCYANLDEADDDIREYLETAAVEITLPSGLEVTDATAERKPRQKHLDQLAAECRIMLRARKNGGFVTATADGHDPLERIADIITKMDTSQ